MKRKRTYKHALPFALALALALTFSACRQPSNGGASSEEKGAEDSLGAVQGTAAPAQGSPAPPAGDPALLIDSALDSGPSMTVRVEDREEARPFSGVVSLFSMARQGSSLLFLGERGEETVLGLSGYTVLEDGRPSVSPAKELEMAPLPFDGEAICYAVTAGGDGNFYLLAGNQENDISTELVIQRYSPAGAYMDSMEIPDWKLLTVRAFSVGSSGEIVLGEDYTVCVYRWQEGLIHQEELGQTVYSSSLCGQGLVVSTYSERDWAAPYLLVDSGTGKLRPLPLSDRDPSGDRANEIRRKSGSLLPCQSYSGEYLINQGDCISLINFETDTLEPLIEWNVTGNSPDTCGPSCRLGENSFACLSGGKLILAWAKTVEKREGGIVRVGMIDMRGTLAQKVRRANTADCPYTYEITQFGRGEGDKLRAELAAGSFDLVLFYGELNTGSNTFEDLYPYIDADPDLSRDSFLPHLLESTSVHGELHQLWNSVFIHTMTAPESVAGDGRGLTVAGCERLVEETQGLQSVFDNKFSDSEGLKQDMLQNIAYLAMTAFVDKESAACRFDSREFQDLLALAGSMKANPDSNGHDWLLSGATVSSAESVAFLEEKEGSLAFVGYPDGGDGIHYYSLPNDFENCMTMAIPSNSKSKVGAWTFIKTMLSHSNQSGLSYGMPVIYEVVKEETERTVNEQVAAKFYDLLERTKYAEQATDETLFGLIVDSCQAYLAGTKTLEETAKLVQSRASLYVSEQYG